MKQKEYVNDTIHLWLKRGDIYLEQYDGFIKITNGYKMPYFKELADMKTRIYFEYGKDKYFYFDKEGKYIYFLVNEDDITLLKRFIQSQENEYKIEPLKLVQYYMKDDLTVIQ